MIFPYKKISESKYGPVVPIALKGLFRWVPFNAFVDSGADYSVFHSDVAVLMGLQITKGKRKTVTVGDGDEMVVSLCTVGVRFSGFVFKAPIAFSSALGSGFNLIGRETFFEIFKICFNDRDKILKTTRLR